MNEQVNPLKKSLLPSCELFLYPEDLAFADQEEIIESADENRNSAIHDFVQACPRVSSESVTGPRARTLVSLPKSSIIE